MNSRFVATQVEKGPPADLSDQATRARLTPTTVKAILRLFDKWKLTSADARALLGGISERTWFRMKAGEWRETLSQDEMTRASALVGIFKGLHLYFSDALADEWVTRPNTGPLFGGRRPVDLMIAGGIPSLVGVRDYVDAIRGGM